MPIETRVSKLEQQEDSKFKGTDSVQTSLKDDYVFIVVCVILVKLYNSIDQIVATNTS